MKGKYPCSVIRDLLPLYMDECCSEDSRQAVEKHLEECPECKREWERASGAIPELEQVPEEAVELPEEAPERTMKRGLKKVRRVWLSSLAGVLVLAVLGYLGWNQYRGSGVCYTNLNDLWIAHSFMSALKQGEYEKAFGYWDLEKEKKELEWTSFEPFDDYPEYARKYFFSSTQRLIDAGGITDYRLVSIDNLNGHLQYEVSVGGELYPYLLTIYVGDDGIFSLYGEGGVDALPDPEPLTALGLWQLYVKQDFLGFRMVYEDGVWIAYED